MKFKLIRGLPGSGKSTRAKNFKGYSHFEADHYQHDCNGVYRFEPTILYLCHKLCIKSTELALARGEDVVVSNTFVTRRELKPYLDLAFKFDADLEIIECTGNYKNIHNVPEETIERMRSKWQTV